MSGRTIVVGVDGSDGGRRALRWAVEQARDGDVTVQAVTAWQWDGIEGLPMAGNTPQQARERAARQLAETVEAVARETTPPGGTPPVIATELVEGDPAVVLTQAARTADLLVLGSHGHSRFRHAVLGSVSEECIRRATCPVVVIPVPQEHPQRPAAPAVPG